MTQILERFQSDLNAEGVARYKLGQELERTKHDATKTKGRVGALEMMGERVHEKADELALSVAEQNHSRPAVPSNPVRGGSDLTVTQSQLQDALAEIGDLTLEIGQHETAINGLVARLDEKKASSNNETTDLTAADYASRMNKDVMDRGRKMPEAVCFLSLIHHTTVIANESLRLLCGERSRRSCARLRCSRKLTTSSRRTTCTSLTLN